MTDSKKFLKGILALELKRLPDGTTIKYKARFCVRGDLRAEGVYYFETYAYVVKWSTVRLDLTMILSHTLHTKQVDYANTIYQADIKERNIDRTPKESLGELICTIKFSTIKESLWT